MTHKDFTTDNTAMLLIDHQVGTMGWVRSVSLEEMEMNTIILAKAAKAIGMPVVLTSSMEDAPQGPLMPQLQEILPDEFESRIKRGGIVNCWKDPDFSGAARMTGKKNFIMAGVTTDVCLAPPAISAVAEGFGVKAVVDASGSPTQIADDMAFRQMEQGGVYLTTTNALVAELAGDWSSEAGMALITILGEEKLSKMS